MLEEFLELVHRGFVQSSMFMQLAADRTAW